jgi:hypothetical protein
MARNRTRKPGSLFQTSVGILIAALTTAGAAAVWRISVAGGKAAEEDAQGLMAALRASNAAMTVSTTLSNNLSLFIEYRQHLAAAALLEKEAASASDPVRRSSLRRDALRERNRAATARTYVDPDYLAVDASDGREYFDGNRYWEARLASEASFEPLDEKPFFDRADRLRGKARSLAGVSAGLGVALFLLVAASVGRGRTRFYLAGAGTLIFFLSSAAAVLIEIYR